MAVGFSNTNKPLNPRGQDASPKGYNRASLYSGKALDFDGVNDNVNLDGFTLSGTTATICFNGLTTGSNRYFFWVGGKNYGIINHDTLGLGIFDSATWNYFGTTQRSEMNSYCVVNEGTTQRAYCNGVQIGSDATATAIDWSSPSKVLLGSNNAENEFLNGQLSGFKIFNTALTAAQVADLYNNPEKVVPTGVAESNLKLWLPMQEGAGTTAYDGSGNGNHGTISGATYVHGIGAPVAQTAVIDWNKGENLISDSEDFSQWSNVSQFVIYNTDDTTAPDGQTTADKITEDTSTNHHRFYKQIAFGTEGGSNQSYTISGFVKYIDRQYISIGLSDNSAYNGLVNFDLINGTIGGEYTYNGSTFSNKTITDVGNDWWKFSVTITSPTWAGGSIYAIAYLQQSSSVSIGVYTGQSKSVHVWGWNTAKANYTTPYIPTLSTAQPTPVLLPQGLTTGRDITGVNLFENVRKQGALNLDGKSWAEVHDNASLDVTDAITLECWINSTDKDQYHHIISKSTTTSGAYAMVSEVTTGYLGFQSALGAFVKTDYNVMDGNWNHIVVVYDEVNAKFYINGALDDTIAETTAIGTNDIKVHIGARGNGIQLFESDIAQPRIYNRALTAEEVQRNYNAGKNTYTN